MSDNQIVSQAHSADAYTGRFSTRLGLARQAAYMTPSHLAEEAGLPEERVAHLESGQESPSLAEVRRLSRAASSSADYLLATRPVTDDCYAGMPL